MPCDQVRKLVGMYHFTTFQQNKDKCLDSLTKAGLDTRLVFTSAFGYGVDMESVNFIVHFGPPFDTVDYVQQIGRAGRGKVTGYNQCHAVMYVFPRSTRDISKNMNSFILFVDKTCLRTFLFSPFSSTNELVKPLTSGHFCCTFCFKSCDCCESCNKSTSFNQEVSNSKKIEMEIVRNVSESDEKIVRECLQEYHDNF